MLESRSNPRAAFGFGRRSLYWDAMDFAYFSGYAMWNYTTLPFLLATPGFTVGKPSTVNGMTRLRVGFPPGLPTHSPTQDLYFDPPGSSSGTTTPPRWSAPGPGLSTCGELPEIRRVVVAHPATGLSQGPFNRPVPLPTLVAIDIHDAQTHRG